MDRLSGASSGGAAENGGPASGALGAVQSYLGGLVSSIMPSVREEEVLHLPFCAKSPLRGQCPAPCLISIHRTRFGPAAHQSRLHAVLGEAHCCGLVGAGTTGPARLHLLCLIRRQRQTTQTWRCWTCPGPSRRAAQRRRRSSGRGMGRDQAQRTLAVRMRGRLPQRMGMQARRTGMGRGRST